MIKEYLRNINPGRMLIMLIGNIFLGLGVAIFKLSGLGNDPFNGMAMAIADYIAENYAMIVVLINAVLFVVEILLSRKLIGMGTLVNAFLLGYIVTFFYDILLFTIGQPEQLIWRIVTVCIGVIVCGFGISMYQSSNMGISPYDSLALTITARCPKLPYFFCRICTDSICTVICFVYGGIINIGTLVSVIGCGPIVQFFDVHFTQKLLKKVDTMYQKSQAMQIR